MDDKEAESLRRLCEEVDSDELSELSDPYFTNSGSEYEPSESSSYSENEVPMAPNHSNKQNKNQGEILSEVSSLNIQTNVLLTVINISEY